jgi:hypothetical protein
MPLLSLYRRSSIYITVPEEFPDLLAKAGLHKPPTDQHLNKVPARVSRESRIVRFLDNLGP